MGANTTLKNLLAFMILFVAGSNVVYGQYSTINQPAVSPEFHIYKITAAQGLALVNNSATRPDSGYFDHIQTALPTGHMLPELPQGHYLNVYAGATTLHYSYFFITRFNIYILDNSTDLLLQLRDKHSDSIVRDAVLTIGKKQIPFDAATGAYRLARSYEQGRLQVSYHRDTFTYSLVKDYNKPKKGLAWLVFRKPFRYVAVPVYIKEHLPVDTYYSIRDRGPRGAVYTLMHGMNKLYRKLTAMFRRKETDAYEYEDYAETFFFFSKPKYRPGDTIRFNALLRGSQTGKWLHEPLKAVLNAYNKQITLGVLQPAARGGGYHYAFVPADSFGMKLDQSYTISLLNNKGTQVGAGNFYYEAYELKKADFAIKGPLRNEQVRGQPLRIEFTAKDKNGLPLPDTKAEVYVCRYSMGSVGPSRLFVPDTIASYSFNITDGSRTFLVNDSIFPDADFSYYLYASMRSAAFEKANASYLVQYSRKKTELKMDAIGDKLFISMLQNDTAVPAKARLLAFDAFQNLIADTMVALPCYSLLNPHVASYTCTAEGGWSQTFAAGGQPAQLEVHAARDAEAIAFEVINPRNLAFTWQLYRINKEIERGQGRALVRQFPVSNTDKYYIQLQYIWAGKGEQLTYEVPLPDKKIQLTVAQPGTIFPGKETEIVITAKDYRNRPLQGVSIFTYGLTAAFENIYQPQLPYMGKPQPGKTVVNNFRLENLAQYGSLALNYPRWKSRMHLDSLYAYRFLYPSVKTETVTVPTPDSSTQVAPFIVAGGVLQQVRYVALDKVPVYFGFTDVKMPYSFLVTDTNYHQLAIQTATDYIFIDSLKPRQHVKSIFSIDVNNLPRNVHRRSGADYTDFSGNVFSYNTASSEGRISFLENYDDPDELYILPPNYAGDYYGLTMGPVHGSRWIMAAKDVFEQEISLERNFTYQVQHGLVKMVRNATQDYRNFQGTALPPLTDFALNPRQLRDSIRKSTHIPFVPFRYFEAGDKGDRSINVDMSPVSEAQPQAGQPLYYVLQAKDKAGFVRVSATPFSVLTHLPAGEYELAIIYRDHRYFSAGTITPVARGYSYYRAEKLQPLADKRLELLESLLVPATGDTAEMFVMQRLYNYFQQYSDDPHVMVTGTVKDKKGIPLPNASIYAGSGDTRKEAATNYYGQFSIVLSRKEFEQGRLYVRYYHSQGNRSLMLNEDVKPALMLRIVLDTDNPQPRRSRAGTEPVVVHEPSGEPTEALGDVVVYGQPSLRQASYTASASMVSSESIELSPAADLAEMVVVSAGMPVMGSGVPVGTSVLLRGNGSLAGGNSPLIVLDGALYFGSLQSVDPAYIEGMATLGAAEATALYGARAVNGVIVITTKKGVQLPAAITALKQPLEASPVIPDDIMAGSLRSHFSDEAFWQPALVTDKHGRVSFKVKFPDDMTSWKTFVYATDDRQHTGQATGIIRSFKPLAATLSLPRFMVAGDTVCIQGKSVQYGDDTVTVTTAFYKNDSLAAEHSHQLGRYAMDSLLLHQAGGDSVRVKYLLQKADGYFDGEERTIPVMRKGTGIAEGAFVCLDSRDTLIHIPSPGDDTLHLAATASLIDVIVEEVKLLKEYKYLCNEQLSSKILATLTQQKLYEALRKPFTADDRKFVQEMVDLLSKRQQGRQLWGWWADGAPSLWISSHVVHALTEARKMNYRVTLDFQGVTWQLIRNFETDSTYTDLDALQLIHATGVKIDFEKYLARYDRRNPARTLAEKLRTTRMRQEFGLRANTAFLKAYSSTDIFGNVYWKDSAQYVYQNEMINTVNALHVLSADSSNRDINPRKVVNWLLQQRKPGGWRNTYESALIIEALARYVPLGDSLALQPVLHLSGGINTSVSSFPYKATLAHPQPVTVQKTGAAPVYFTYYQRKWDTSALQEGNQFRVGSAFLDNSDTTMQLTAGKPVRLQVSIKAEKDAEFVMIEVPIPASCSYNSKASYGYGYEIHREYFDDHVSIFCEKLPAGVYQYTVDLLPKYTGTYTLNPAKAELMYFPVFYGKEGVKQISVK